MKSVVYISCMAILAFTTLVTGAFSSSDLNPASDISKEVMKCMVCKAVVDEVEFEIEKVDPKKKIDIGSFRLDGNGNIKQNMVVDQICSGPLKDYVVGSYKATGQPTLLRLTTPDGNMNPDMSNVDIVSDPTVNEKLGYYCHQLVEDYEDDIISMFGKKEKDPHHKLCVALSGFCPKNAIVQDDDSDDYEREEL